MFTLEPTRARLRIRLATDTTESGAGPQTRAETVTALEGLDGDPTSSAEADTADDEAEEPDGADELGDKGKQALERMKERLRAERTKRQAAEDGAEQAKKAERDALAKANQRIVRAEVRAAAAGRLVDPVDALQFLDLSAFEVDDDGQVDADDIADAITDLLNRKPYLAAQGGPRSPVPDPAQGGTGRGPATAADRFAAQFSNF